MIARISPSGPGTATSSSRSFTRRTLACRLTLDRLFGGLRVGACIDLADVVAGCSMLVGDAGWASGAGSAGFRRVGRNGDLRSEAAKSAADPGRGQPPGCAGPFPGVAQVGGQVAGQAQLGVGGDDQPGPAVGSGGIAQLGGGPAEGLLEEPEGVFEVEPAQEGLPGPVDVDAGRGRVAGPQPQRFRGAVAGQVLDL